LLIKYIKLLDVAYQVILDLALKFGLNGSATRTSNALKDLALPGIGYFTALDSRKVSPSAPGTNFFSESPSNMSKYRAEQAVRLLREPNGDVDRKTNTRSLKSVMSTEE
jgi:amyloid beta precursor protein binding protein 1